MFQPRRIINLGAISGSPFRRRATAALAIVALMSHGLAMVLAGALAPAGPAQAAASGLPAVMPICTAHGVVLVAFDEAERNLAGGEGDGPDSGAWQDCPICSAFAQQGLGLPSGVEIGRGATQEPIFPAPQAVIAGTVVFLPRSRAPPQPL
ncbi:DUF2946 family protein [Pelagibius sp.]|uniref:DUF2946 family protein n=1 Tax=Pelagibius sp. TaxID=1931238 RepID=UPI0026350010|nr:DUF2946 family protein [Pelagibius sp.]